MKNTVPFLVLLGIAAALPMREKRQAVGCLSAFQNVPNLCANNVKGQVFFQHPTDPSKFLQCDINNRMYIVQCPAGEVFNARTTACQPAPSAQVTLPRPQTNGPATATVLPPTVKNNTPGLIGQQTSSTAAQKTPGLPPQKTPGLPPQKTPGLPPQKTPGLLAAQTTASVPVVTSANNPCSSSNLAQGKLFFPFPGDKGKFYECDLKGNAQVLSCPSSLQWDQKIQSCVYPMNTNQQGNGNGTPHVLSTPQIPSGLSGNPCTAKAIAAGRFFSLTPATRTSTSSATCGGMPSPTPARPSWSGTRTWRPATVLW